MVEFVPFISTSKGTWLWCGSGFSDSSHAGYWLALPPNATLSLSTALGKLSYASLSGCHISSWFPWRHSPSFSLIWSIQESCGKHPVFCTCLETTVLGSKMNPGWPARTGALKITLLSIRNNSVTGQSHSLHFVRSLKLLQPQSSEHLYVYR